MKTNTAVIALRISGLSALIAVLGLLIGAMVVILPPMAAIGVLGLIAGVLIWVTPELNQVSIEALRNIFLLFIVTQICFPAYYAVQISGLPWISPRRITGFFLIVTFLVNIGTSSASRRVIVAALSSRKPLSFCIIGFMIMALISITTSTSPSESLVHFSDALLNWYIPMFACLLIVQNHAHIIQLFKLIGVLSLFVAMVGVLEFATHHRVALDLIPRSLLSAMMAANPSLVGLVNSDPIRNGLWRASSIYNVPLSFGEFAVMVAPIGVYFILHGSKTTERILGFAVLCGAMLSLFVSGSRGGTIGFVISMPIFVGLWTIRYARSHPNSLAGAISGMAALLGTTSMVAAIFFIGRLQKVVLGGGESAASNDGRLLQWTLGIPHIIANPFTGHGFGMGAAVVGWVTPGGEPTIDSYVLTVLVEMGVPGFLLFFGSIVFATLYCIRLYIENARDDRAAIAAPFVCSMIAFGFYRIALSQRENHTLFFIFLALVLKLIQYTPRISRAGSIATKIPFPRGVSEIRGGFRTSLFQDIS